MKMRYQVPAVVAAAALGAAAAANAVIATGGGGHAATTTETVIRQAQPAASTTSSAAKSVSQIYVEDTKGIVEITVRERSSTGQSFGFGAPQSETQTAQGTGFEIDAKGDIVTNAHVVSGASSITVTTKNGKRYAASVVGSDPTTDVAVIHISASASDLHPLSFADSSTVSVGDPVVAIGDPYGLTDSASTGIVSALGRTIMSPNNHPITNAIQTDAAINHGNSGGPLLDGQGDVIGITSQIYADSSTSGNVGIGFAVPSSTVERIATELIRTGKASHPYLGVYLQDTAGGARIARVTSGSPAAAAGLTTGEVITAVDGHAVAGSAAVVRAVGELQPGDKAAITLRSGSSTRTVTVTIGSTS
ncbi:MAG TPA: trypsin-like peptidase domain-containing protein [Gaiellales bacterium]|nr:trypsin-like peptidase domain-containing protein [Gaiellales bacterium]